MRNTAMKSARRLVQVCLAISVLLWIASLFVGIAYVPQSGRFRFSCFAGVVLVHFLDIANNHPPPDALQPGALKQYPRGAYVFGEAPLNHHYILPVPGYEVVFAPFNLFQISVVKLWLPQISPSGKKPAWHIKLPTIAPALILSLISLYWLLPFHRRRVRHRLGQCVACGYDLTGNQSGKCPECGIPTPQSEPAAPAGESP